MEEKKCTCELNGGKKALGQANLVKTAVRTAGSCVVVILATYTPAIVPEPWREPLNAAVQALQMWL